MNAEDNGFNPVTHSTDVPGGSVRSVVQSNGMPSVVSGHVISYASFAGLVVCVVGRLVKIIIL